MLEEELFDVSADESDVQLLRRYRTGDQSAFYQLANRFFLILRNKAAAYSGGADTDDLVQEGLIGLNNAALTYDENASASFRTYADACIRNRMLSALRRSSPEKERMNGTVTSIEEAKELESPPECDPLNAVIVKEELQALESYLREQLSPAESRVLDLYLLGLGYDEIAERLGITRKSCDNAMQRVRKKLRERY